MIYLVAQRSFKRSCFHCISVSPLRRSRFYLTASVEQNSFSECISIQMPLKTEYALRGYSHCFFSTRPTVEDLFVSLLVLSTFKKFHLCRDVTSWRRRTTNLLLRAVAMRALYRANVCRDKGPRSVRSNPKGRDSSSNSCHYLFRAYLTKARAGSLSRWMTGHTSLLTLFTDTPFLTYSLNKNFNNLQISHIADFIPWK